MARTTLIVCGIASLIVLGGCQPQIGQYATNAEQCKGAYDEVRAQFRRNTVGQSGLGSGLGKAIVRDQQERAYQECLARVGAGSGGTTVRTYTYGTPPAAAPEQQRYTKRQRGAAILSGGAGYHGSYLEGGVGKTQTAAPAKPKKLPATPKGKLPLPVQYPLLPGDAELWPTLTLAQQQRAMLFLQDGSTIRASLRTD